MNEPAGWSSDAEAYLDDRWFYSKDGSAVLLEHAGRRQVYRQPTPSGDACLTAAYMMVGLHHGLGSLGLDMDRATAAMLDRFDGSVPVSTFRHASDLWSTLGRFHPDRAEYVRQVISPFGGGVRVSEPLTGDQVYGEEGDIPGVVYDRFGALLVFIKDDDEFGVFGRVSLASPESVFDSLRFLPALRDDPAAAWLVEEVKTVACERFGRQVWDRAVFEEQFTS